MNFKIKLPFTEIRFNNAKKSHKDYFTSLFFISLGNFPQPKYTITVNFKNITLPENKKLYLEEDIAASKGDIYISDTKNNKIKMNPSSFKSNNVELTVDPGFDLYYLYNNFIEPLLIIWAASKSLLYIHSSAISKEDGAYIFPAWRHTGKTSSIFNMAKEDIEFLGDDFSILKDSKVYLYPKYINVFSYNFESYPWLYDNLPSLVAMRIKLSVQLKKLLYNISQNLSGSLSKVFFRLSELAEISTNTKVAPADLGLSVQTEAPFKKAVFIVKSNSELKKEQKLTKIEIEQKLITTTKHEVREFIEVYRKYKFLYPKAESKVIESFEDNYKKAIRLNLKEAYESHIVNLPHNDAYLNL